MNESEFGTTLTNVLGMALPTTFLAILLLLSAVCAFGTLTVAARIGGRESSKSFSAAWLIWGLGLSALASAAWVSHINSVSAILAHFSPTTQRVTAQFVAIAYLTPTLLIALRSIVEIVKRLAN
jgi:hypothetical protein